MEFTSPPSHSEPPASIPSNEDSSTLLLNQRQHEQSVFNEDGTHVELSKTSVPIGIIQNSQNNAPDGGYGWFIVVGSFISHFILGGTERSEGIVFIQFQHKFDQSAQLTAWPGAIASSIRLLFAPLASSISNCYSVRTCYLIGSLVLFISLLMTSFAPNFWFIFFSYALVQGIGRGLLYAPSLIIVNLYFNKRRSLSTGLATSGVSFGSIIFVPLVQFLFDVYGFTGAFLIISAIASHIFVVAMLFRPLSKNGISKTSNISITEESKRNHLGNSRGICTSMFEICFPKENSSIVEKKNKKIFHFYLLKDPAFLLFCISFTLFTAAFRSAFTFVPALVTSKGYTETQAAFLISIAGVTDAISRIGVGFLFDLRCLRHLRVFFYNVYPFVLAIISVTFPSLDSYIAFCIMNSLYGLFTAAYISQKSVVVCDISGLENMTSAFGMVVCFQGLGSAIGPPIAGAFKDMFGSFNSAFYFGGAIMCLAGIIMTISNILVTKQQHKNKNEIVIQVESTCI